MIPNQVNELLNSPKTFPLPLRTTKQPPDFFFPLPVLMKYHPSSKELRCRIQVMLDVSLHRGLFPALYSTLGVKELCPSAAMAHPGFSKALLTNQRELFWQEARVGTSIFLTYQLLDHHKRVSLKC